MFRKARLNRALEQLSQEHHMPIEEVRKDYEIATRSCTPLFGHVAEGRRDLEYGIALLDVRDKYGPGRFERWFASFLESLSTSI